MATSVLAVDGISFSQEPSLRATTIATTGAVNGNSVNVGYSQHHNIGLYDFMGGGVICGVGGYIPYWNSRLSYQQGEIVYYVGATGILGTYFATAAVPPGSTPGAAPWQLIQYQWNATSTFPVGITPVADGGSNYTAVNPVVGTAPAVGVGLGQWTLLGPSNPCGSSIQLLQARTDAGATEWQMDVLDTTGISAGQFYTNSAGVSGLNVNGIVKADGLSVNAPLFSADPSSGKGLALSQDWVPDGVGGFVATVPGAARPAKYGGGVYPAHIASQSTVYTLASDAGSLALCQKLTAAAGVNGILMADPAGLAADSFLVRSIDPATGIAPAAPDQSQFGFLLLNPSWS